MKNHALQCVENYYTTLKESPQTIYSGFIGIVNEYIIHHLDTIKNNDYKKISTTKMRSYLISGVQCLTHVFNMLILYTKNLHLTLYHSQRAFYFYVEFMEQMSDDMHTFLQLTPKDACLFVYKKTIYEINHDYRCNYNIEETLEEKIIHQITTFYTGQIVHLISENEDIINIIKLVSNDLHKVIQLLNKVSHKVNNESFYEKLLELNEYCYKHQIKNNDYKQLEKYIKTFKTK